MGLNQTPKINKSKLKLDLQWENPTWNFCGIPFSFHAYFSYGSPKQLNFHLKQLRISYFWDNTRCLLHFEFAIHFFLHPFFFFSVFFFLRKIYWGNFIQVDNFCLGQKSKIRDILLTATDVKRTSLKNGYRWEWSRKITPLLSARSDGKYEGLLEFSPSTTKIKTRKHQLLSYDFLHLSGKNVKIHHFSQSSLQWRKDKNY